MTAALFLQLFVSAELLIFPMRTGKFFFMSMAAPWLYVAVLGSCLLFTILSALGEPTFLFKQPLGWTNVGLAWLWSIGGLIIMDIFKMFVQEIVEIRIMQGSNEEIPVNEERVPEIDSAALAEADKGNRGKALQKAGANERKTGAKTNMNNLPQLQPNPTLKRKSQKPGSIIPGY